MRATVVGLAALLGVIIAVSANAASTAATRHEAFTNTAGVTYNGGSGHAIFDFHTKPAGGTADVGTATQHNLYTATIVCAAFPKHGVAYWGARATGDPAGDYVFWRVTSGGPGVGTVAGLTYHVRTCYSGHNSRLAGPVYTITAGKISVR